MQGLVQLVGVTEVDFEVDCFGGGGGARTNEADSLDETSRGGGLLGVPNRKTARLAARRRNKVVRAKGVPRPLEVACALDFQLALPDFLAFF